MEKEQPQRAGDPLAQSVHVTRLPSQPLHHGASQLVSISCGRGVAEATIVVHTLNSSPSCGGGLVCKTMHVSMSVGVQG